MQFLVAFACLLSVSANPLFDGATDGYDWGSLGTTDGGWNEFGGDGDWGADEFGSTALGTEDLGTEWTYPDWSSGLYPPLAQTDAPWFPVQTAAPWNLVQPEQQADVVWPNTYPDPLQPLFPPQSGFQTWDQLSQVPQTAVQYPYQETWNGQEAVPTGLGLPTYGR